MVIKFVNENKKLIGTLDDNGIFTKVTEVEKVEEKKEETEEKKGE